MCKKTHCTFTVYIVITFLCLVKKLSQIQPIDYQTYKTLLYNTYSSVTRNCSTPRESSHGPHTPWITNPALRHHTDTAGCRAYTHVNIVTETSADDRARWIRNYYKYNYTFVFSHSILNIARYKTLIFYFNPSGHKYNDIYKFLFHLTFICKTITYLVGLQRDPNRW